MNGLKFIKNIWLLNKFLHYQMYKEEVFIAEIYKKHLSHDLTPLLISRRILYLKPTQTYIKLWFLEF